jgi:hypothetical protein
MIRMLFATALMATLAFGAGCAMCDNALDYGPSAIGGVCADGACGHRAGSIISGPCGETVGEVVVTEKAFPGGSELLSAEPVPAMPLEMQLEEATPLEMESDFSLIPGDGATPSLDPPAPDPGLFFPIESEPAEVESEGLEVPVAADASDSRLLPLGPAVAPPVPDETGVSN